MRLRADNNCVSTRVRMKRLKRRGLYDRQTIFNSLDGGLFCHLAFIFDDYPVVLPMLYWRDGDRGFWHGSTASRMLRAVDGAQVRLAVTHFDGLVLARSAFNHTANYRSVALFGIATAVEGTDETLAHLEKMTESIWPGRWKTLRPVNTAELKATRVMSIAISEASAKVRHGPANDPKDFDWPVWAGVVPFSLSAGAAWCDGEGKSAELSPPSFALPSTARA